MLPAKNHIAAKLPEVVENDKKTKECEQNTCVNKNYDNAIKYDTNKWKEYVPKVDTEKWKQSVPKVDTESWKKYVPKIDTEEWKKHANQYDCEKWKEYVPKADTEQWKQYKANYNPEKWKEYVPEVGTEQWKKYSQPIDTNKWKEYFSKYNTGSGGYSSNHGYCLTLPSCKDLNLFNVAEVTAPSGAKIRFKLPFPINEKGLKKLGEHVRSAGGTIEADN